VAMSRAATGRMTKVVGENMGASGEG
jgi:hypothetical protein